MFEPVPKWMKLAAMPCSLKKPIASAIMIGASAAVNPMPTLTVASSARANRGASANAAVIESTARREIMSATFTPQRVLHLDIRLTARAPGPHALVRPRGLTVRGGLSAVGVPESAAQLVTREIVLGDVRIREHIVVVRLHIVIHRQACFRSCPRSWFMRDLFPNRPGSNGPLSGGPGPQRRNPPALARIGCAYGQSPLMGAGDEEERVD
jgi:hypothetical protein